MLPISMLLFIFSIKLKFWSEISISVRIETNYRRCPIFPHDSMYFSIVRKSFTHRSFILAFIVISTSFDILSQLLFWRQFPFIVLVCSVPMAPFAASVVPTGCVYGFCATVRLAMFFPWLDGFIEAHFLKYGHLSQSSSTAYLQLSAIHVFPL